MQTKERERMGNNKKVKKNKMWIINKRIFEKEKIIFKYFSIF